MLNKEKEDLNLIYNAFIGGIDQPQGCYRYKYVIFLRIKEF